MVKSPSEWKILEWDDEPQTNKQTNWREKDHKKQQQNQQGLILTKIFCRDTWVPGLVVLASLS